MKKATAGILVIVLLGAAAAWYLNARKPVADHPSAVPQTGPEIAIEPPQPEIEYPIESVQSEFEPAQDLVEEPAPEPLPELAASDPAMSELLNDLLSGETLADLLITDQFINRVVATIDSLPSRKVAPLVLPVRPPSGKFQVVGEDAPFTASPDNDARYLPYVELIESVDVDAAVRAYVHFYPLFQQAYQALGYPDSYFNDRLVEVIDHLLQTPEPSVSPLLERHEAVYVYQDEDLEGLSAGQKALLRIGADKRKTVLDRLEQLRSRLTQGWPDQEMTR